VLKGAVPLPTANGKREPNLAPLANGYDPIASDEHVDLSLELTQ
jgi:hypothetical protein